MEYDEVLKDVDNWGFYASMESAKPGVMNEHHTKAARLKMESAIKAYAQAHADKQNLLKEQALQAARLLCANLDHGGVGHMALVENFRRKDDLA